MAEETTVEKTDDIIEEARERFKLCQEAEEDNRRRAQEAIEFLALSQWDEKLRREREANGRPCLVVDKLNQHLRQVMNDQRQNRPAIKIRPVDDKSDKKVAEMLQGLVRNIEDQSGADIAYDTAFDHALSGGFGYFRVLTEFSSDDSFEQDIKIARIPNRFTVYLDPNHTQPDGSDAKYAFVVEEMTKDEYEEQYGEDGVDWDADCQHYDDWIAKDKIRVAEYFRIVEEDTEIHLLPDGSTHVGPLVEGVESLKTRKTRINSVKWSKLNGKSEIEKSDWIGKYIPIIEVIGNETWLNGKRHLSGMVEAAMDPQRMHNYASSAFVEMVALAPKSPWIAANGQIEGFEKIWQVANVENISVLPYKPVSVEGHPVPPPIRQPMQSIPAGWQQLMLNTEHDIQGALGRYQASLGQESNEKSGKAIMARQREGDVATFHYIDNLARSLRYCGRILVDLIPKVYDTRRVARVLGEDGTTETVMIDPESQAPSGEWRNDVGQKIGMIYNPSIGKYDVAVTVGTSYTTKRQEAAEFMVNAMNSAKDPASASVLTYLAVKNQDVAGADEATRMLKALLPPQVLESEKTQNPDDINRMAEQVQQASQMLEQKAMELAQKEQAINEMAQQLQELQQQVASEGMDAEKQKAELQRIESEIKIASKELEADRAVFRAERALLMEQIKAQQLQAENEQLRAAQGGGEPVRETQEGPE